MIHHASSGDVYFTPSFKELNLIVTVYKKVKKIKYGFFISDLMYLIWTAPGLVFFRKKLISSSTMEETEENQEETGRNGKNQQETKQKLKINRSEYGLVAE